MIQWLREMWCYFCGHTLDIVIGQDARHRSWYVCTICGHDIRNLAHKAACDAMEKRYGPCGCRWHAPDCDCGGAGGDR